MYVFKIRPIIIWDAIISASRHVLAAPAHSHLTYKLTFIQNTLLTYRVIAAITIWIINHTITLQYVGRTTGYDYTDQIYFQTTIHNI